MLFQLWPAGWQQTLVSKGLSCLSSYLNEDGSDDEEEVGEHKDVTTCDSQVTVWNQYKWYSSLRWGLSVTIKMVFGDIGEALLMLRILSPLNERRLADNELTYSQHVFVCHLSITSLWSECLLVFLEKYYSDMIPGWQRFFFSLTRKGPSENAL